MGEFVTLSEAICVPAIRAVCEEELDYMFDGGEMADPLIFAHTRGFPEWKKKYMEKVTRFRFESSSDKLLAHPDLMMEIIKVREDFLRCR